MDFSTLNPEQVTAVRCTEGPLLILAGAGSGKTRVITHRIAYLLEKGVLPEHIVALSFTNKAAEEMRERLQLMVGKQVADKLNLSTFHSLGVKMMREMPVHFAVPERFTVYDQGDVYGLIRTILREQGYHGSGNDRRYDVGAIAQRISLWKNNPRDWQSMQTEQNDYDEIATQVYQNYQKRLTNLGAVDFDDLICRVATVLNENSQVRHYWQAKFSYVMVDEYQDTNQVQFELLRSLVDQRENLCVVGDDDQAIYGWRGAKVTNILGFEMYYPNAKIIKLERNYRSCEPILICANKVIEKNRLRQSKQLIPQRQGGQPINLIIAADGEQESRWVGTKIFKLIHEEKKSAKDIAVLYRSARQSKAIEEHLQAHGLDYRVLGGQAFYDKKQVKDVLAYLKVLVSPQDEAAVRRALDVPGRGVGSKTLELLVNYAKLNHISLMKAIEQQEKITEISSRARQGLVRFVELIHSARTQLHVTNSAATVLRKMMEAVGMYEHIVKETGSAEAASHRWSDVEWLFASLERFVERSQIKQEKPRWHEFFVNFDLGASKQDTENDSHKLTLATLHSAKGLEWPIVFMIGCEEGIMPHKRISAPRISDAITGDIEEERRLFYVGMTRARDLLFLTRANKRSERGKLITCAPSRFLNELPSNVTYVYEIDKEEQLSMEQLQSLADSFLAKLAAS